MADQQVVLGIFADEAAADLAVASLKDWDQATDEIKLGAIGVLVADEFGQIKEHKLGARSGKKGAGIGLVLAIVAPPTLLAGLVGGGILGHSTTRAWASAPKTGSGSVASFSVARRRSASWRPMRRPARSSASSQSWVEQSRPTS